MMPAKSKAQFRLMKAAQYNPKIAKKVGISEDVAKEFTQSNVGKKAYKKLPEAMKEGGVSLAIGRGEKLPAEQGAGLTAKGRAKYNRETGSNLKAPQPEGGKRRDSFCARMGPVAEKSEKGSRARASMKRWNCPGW
jgi:hypothetical protein